MTFFEFIGIATTGISVLFVVSWFLSRAGDDDIHNICKHLYKLEDRVEKLEKFNKVNTENKSEQR